MVQRRRKRSKKWISWLFFLILLIVAVVVCYFVWEVYFKDKDGTSGREEEGSLVTMSVEEQGEKTEKKEKKEETVEKTEVKQYDGEDPNRSERLTGVMTYLGVSGDDLVARVNVDQYLTSGSCEIRIIRSGEVLYNEVVSVIDSAATSTCEGFNVPLSELSTGQMQVEIKIEAGERAGVISGEVEI